MRLSAILQTITDEIYDTLVGNVGMSEHHVAFDPKQVQQAEVNNNDGIIILGLKSGNYSIVITKIDDGYFMNDSEIVKNLTNGKIRNGEMLK